MRPIEIELTPKGPYSLAASAAFLCGFSPAAGSALPASGGMTFGFGLDGTFEPVAVRVSQVDGRVCVRAAGSRDGDAIGKQVSRILSLDHDGDAWLDVGRRDPAIGMLQARYDALRPVCFYSPYEAACWGILAARTPMKLAARVRQGLAEALGEARVVDGERIWVFPSPIRLLDAATLPGVPAIKAERLRGLAVAALDGVLDAEALRALDREAATARLRALDGVGPWTASHVLVRGAGLADEPAFFEPRVRAGFQLAMQLSEEPTDEELARASERWRPYRTWASVLLAVHLSRSGLWSAPTRSASGARRPPRGARRDAHAVAR